MKLPYTASDAAPKCCSGCKHYYGGEIAHHKDCPYYPESLTKLYDDVVANVLRLTDALETLIQRIDDDSNYYNELETARALLAQIKGGR